MYCDAGGGLAQRRFSDLIRPVAKAYFENTDMPDEQHQPLRFRPDGSFTIVQFTDTHFKNDATEDARTRGLMERVLDLEHPDVVALTGDIVEGKSSRDPAAAWLYGVEPMETRGIPWAAVFGNHDDEGALSRQQLLEVQRTCAMCLTQRGPGEISGVGNYVLPIRSSQSESTSAALFFLDSNSYAPFYIGGYDWIKRDQLQWFADVARRSDGGGCVPKLIFLHIPLPEFDLVWKTQSCRGEKNEDVCCPKYNSGFFAAAQHVGGVMGVLAGHDHINDFDGELNGIRLCYGRATGFGSYGKEGLPRGARVIRLNEGSGRFASWIRLEDDSRLDQ